MADTAYISLGGNMGGEEALFAEALYHINAWEGVRVAKTSAIYRTEPQGDSNQPWFHNQVAELSCEDLSPAMLLHMLLNLETTLGRERDPSRRYGPRRIDLDLLLYGCIVCASGRLTVPHPRMTTRAFVLVPLLEIAPEAALPDGTRLAAALDSLEYHVATGVIHQNERSENNGKSK
ncbi:MAG: 2-amino-4-hydroxy-6-hydroxymethyldihydropteridinepyrophosphokinase [Desulfovibrio sp.]